MQEGLFRESQIKGTWDQRGPAHREPGEGASRRDSKLAMGRGGGLRCRPPPQLPATFTWPSQLHLLPAWTQGHMQAHAHELTGPLNTPETRFGHGGQFLPAKSGPVATNCTTSGSSLLWGPNSSLDQFPYLSCTRHHLQDASRTPPLLSTSTATSLAPGDPHLLPRWQPQTPGGTGRPRCPCFHPSPSTVYSLTSQRDPFKLKPNRVTPQLRHLRGSSFHTAMPRCLQRPARPFLVCAVSPHHLPGRLLPTIVPPPPPYPSPPSPCHTSKLLPGKGPPRGLCTCLHMHPLPQE